MRSESPGRSTLSVSHNDPTCLTCPTCPTRQTCPASLSVRYQTFVCIDATAHCG